MKKTNASSKKSLYLDRETVRVLQQRELTDVIGGFKQSSQSQPQCPGSGGCQTQAPQ
jgi:hypothetical protein